MENKEWYLTLAETEVYLTCWSETDEDANRCSQKGIKFHFSLNGRKCRRGEEEEREWLKSKEWNGVLMSVVCRDNAKDCFLLVPSWGEQDEDESDVISYWFVRLCCVVFIIMQWTNCAEEEEERDRNENEIRGIISHVNRRTGKESAAGRKTE